MMPPFFFVFDVESVGLQGHGFAVGWVVIDTATGATVDREMVYCSLQQALHEASESDVVWVQEHVVPALAEGHGVLVPGTLAVRVTFWSAWQRWKERGALLAADCPWPVEARFLMECVRYTRVGMGRMAGDFDGPYPLIDVASVRLAKGFDPIVAVERLPDELPVHNPLCDARQSARLLMEAMRS